MEVETPPLKLPEGDPPIPEGDPPIPGNLQDGHRISHTSPVSRMSSDGQCSSASFIEILKQIEDLQKRLREVYEQDMVDKPTRPKTLSPSSSRLRQKTSREDNVGHQSSNISLSDNEEPMGPVNSIKAAASLMKEARKSTRNFEETLRRSDLRFQIGPEWNIDDKTLYELEKNRLTVTSPTGTLKTRTVSRTQTHGSTGFPLQGCAMHPESRKRIFWDCCAMVALCIEVLTAPLQVYNVDGVFREVADVLHWLTTSYWFLDVPASFLTAVYINDILHSRLADVARAYFKAWFWFDMAMLAPEVLFFIQVVQDDSESDPAASGVLRALRARRLVRLVRVARLMRFRKVMTLVKKFNFYKNLRMFFQGWISSALFSILMLIVGVMISVHFLASVWFVAGDVTGGWAQVEGLTEASFAQQYTRSVEWAVSRLPASSLRANVELHTAFERWLAIIATFTSLCISSLFVSVLTNIMADVARRTRKMTQILDSVRKYCGTCGLSLVHTMKIRKLVEREHFRENIQDHMHFLLSLPEGLVRELFHEARSLTLSYHPFFQEIGALNSSMELNLCNQAVKELYLLEWDSIFNRNQKAEGIYVLASGAGVYSVDGWTKPLIKRRNSLGTVFGSFIGSSNAQSTEDEMINQPSNGTSQAGENAEVIRIGVEEFLSEQALWIRGWKHHGNFEVTVESRALKLSKTELRNVVQDYSEILAMAVAYARAFVSATNKTSLGDVSDMPLDTSLLDLDAITRSSSLSRKIKNGERFDRVVPGEG